MQCSVWFVAHVVGCGLGAAYLITALECERPMLAGLLLGLSFHHRTSTLFGALTFERGGAIEQGDNDASGMFQTD